MIVRNLMERKGGDVLLAGADDTITATVAAMCERGVGSAVVVGADGLPAGIVTERDILRQLALHGAGLGEMKVAAVMSAPVKTTTPDSTVQSVLQQMTQHRFRHLPVVDEGKLVGIVSIGDAVKARLYETESEAESMRQYIAGQ